MIDNKNTVYVVDRENKRIQVFDTNGIYLNEWKDLGSPFGLAIMNNEFYIADGKNGIVSKLNSDGKIISSYGISGKAAGQFYCRML